MNTDRTMNEIKMNCPFRKRCGGCSGGIKPYSETLKEKEALVGRLLRPYVTPEPIIGMEDPLYYRNKVQRACMYKMAGGKGHHISGIYAEGSHKIIPVERCYIENLKAQEIIQDVLSVLSSFKISRYDETAGSGLLRHILVRTARETGDIMLVLVLTSPVLPGKKNIVGHILRKRPEITTIVLNVNSCPGPYVLGDKESIAYGKGYIEDILCGRRFRISAKSFYQVNPVQTERIYQRAVEYAALNGRQTVVDAYCGIGTIALTAAGASKEMIGVESNPEAVRDAAANARLNHMEHVRFVREDAGRFLMKMAAEGKKTDVIFMDPPRSGASADFIGAACATSPGRIIYISCNPATLARDLGILKKYGYVAGRASVFDQFPWTQHVECVVLLSRK